MRKQVASRDPGGPGVVTYDRPHKFSDTLIEDQNTRIGELQCCERNKRLRQRSRIEHRIRSNGGGGGRVLFARREHMDGVVLY
jgi:hypothetical protein